MPKKLKVGIVGATGAVGVEITKLLELPQWQNSELYLFGSMRSSGKKVPWRQEEVVIQELKAGEIPQLDVVFFAADSAVAKDFAPRFAAEGAIVIDNSSAFRMDKDVPLVVPEINFDSINRSTKIIANPNCSAIIMLMAVAPLRKLGQLKRIIVSTYQSASGAGREAMEELEVSTRAYLDGIAFEPKVLPHPYAFNVFSHNTDIGEDGYNGEETKVIQETRKILNDQDILVNPTCIRVPVLRSHSESITIEFADQAPSLEKVRKILTESEGVKVVDDQKSNYFPMPVDSNGQGEILVGRIRHDVSNPQAISLFVCGDQLLKGAALNAVQIAERIFGISR